MARYMTLLSFTPQSLRNLKQSPARAKAFLKDAAKAGVKVEAQLWTTGACDGVLILQAADETKILRLIAKLAAQGYVSTQTLRAFDAREFTAILGR